MSHVSTPAGASRNDGGGGGEAARGAARRAHAVERRRGGRRDVAAHPELGLEVVDAATAPRSAAPMIGHETSSASACRARGRFASCNEFHELFSSATNSMSPSGDLGRHESRRRVARRLTSAGASRPPSSTSEWRPTRRRPPAAQADPLTCAQSLRRVAAPPLPTDADAATRQRSPAARSASAGASRSPRRAAAPPAPRHLAARGDHEFTGGGRRRRRRRRRLAWCPRRRRGRCRGSRLEAAPRPAAAAAAAAPRRRGREGTGGCRRRLRSTGGPRPLGSGGLGPPSPSPRPSPAAPAFCGRRPATASAGPREPRGDPRSGGRVRRVVVARRVCGSAQANVGAAVGATRWRSPRPPPPPPAEAAARRCTRRAIHEDGLADALIRELVERQQWSEGDAEPAVLLLLNGGAAIDAPSAAAARLSPAPSP